jgi:hypothetical protein
MDPNFNGVWSASEMDMAKSLIPSQITNKTYTNDMETKHIDFVDDLQAMFPWKEKHQVTNLYVELLVEIMRAQSNNQHVVPSSVLVNDNFGMLSKPMDNMKVIEGYLMDEMEAMRILEEQPNMLNVIHKKKRHGVKFWTTDEHRYFIICIDLETFVTHSMLIFS